MDIEPKDGVYFLTTAAAIGAGWNWVKSRLGGHERRLRSLEQRVTNEHGEPMLMSYDAHDKICGRQQEVMGVHMNTLTAAVVRVEKVVSGLDEKVDQALKQQAVIMDRDSRNA